MCKILSVVVAFFLWALANSTFLGRDSLPLVLIHIYGHIALCQQKYNIQALGIIPVVETHCTLTNPQSQSLDWVEHWQHDQH